MAYFFPLTTEGQNFGHGWSFEKLCIIGGESYTNEMILATPYGLNNQNKFHFSLLKTVSQEGWTPKPETDQTRFSSYVSNTLSSSRWWEYRKSSSKG